MKIAIVLTNTNRSTGKFYNHQEIGLARALMPLGVSVDVYEYNAQTKGIQVEMVEEDQNERVRLLYYEGIALPGRQAFSFSLLWYLFRNREYYSLIQVHDNTSVLTVFVSMLGSLVQCPCVLCQGMYKDYAAWHKRTFQRVFYFLFQRLFFNNLDYVIGKTQKALSYLRVKGLPSRVRSTLIGVGLDIAKFAVAQDGTDLSDLHLPSSIDVLYVGVIEDRRNPDFIAALFKELQAKESTLNFCVIGDGPKYQEFIEKIQSYNMADKVRVVKKVPNAWMPAIYGRSKVLILPTNYEIYGMVVLEAMYFGVSVFATREAGPAMIIEDGKNGFLFDELSLSCWSGRIMELLFDAKIRQRIAENASERIKHDFIWDHIAPKYMRVYQDVLAYRSQSNR